MGSLALGRDAGDARRRYTALVPVEYQKVIERPRVVAKQVPYTIVCCKPKVVYKQVPVQVCCPMPCCEKPTCAPGGCR